MASVAIQVDGEHIFIPMNEEGDPLCVTVTAWLDADRKDFYMRDHLSMHGSVEDIRRFAQGILDATARAAE